jgi:hypothetical protein
MRAGMAPYRQIIDINMPGAYFSEFAGMSLFGESDLGWRLYDFALLFALAIAMILIARRYDWYAGLYAAVLFALSHGADGPLQTAERDEVMTVLLVLGYALVFIGVRHRRSLFFFFSALTFAIAATIKPTAIVFELLLALISLLHLRKEGIPIFAFLREMLTGTLSIMLATVAFLLWRSSFGAFIHRSLVLAAFYSGGARPSIPFMLHHSTPRGFLVLLPLTVFLFFRNRSWQNWQFRAIVGGVILGYVSYFIQSKGFVYHRYPFAAFALLWSGLELVVALRRGRLDAQIGYAGLLIGTLLIAPFYVYRIFRFEQPNLLTPALIKDLERYPANQLQGNVQCLDGVAGCYSALFRLHLKQRTGIMGDQLLFSPHANSSVAAVRDEFLRDIQSAPPMIFVETNYRLGDEQTFNKLNEWPQFAEFLRLNYSLAVQRPEGNPLDKNEPLGYRIYLRNP